MMWWCISHKWDGIIDYIKWINKNPRLNSSIEKLASRHEWPSIFPNIVGFAWHSLELFRHTIIYSRVIHTLIFHDIMWWCILVTSALRMTMGRAKWDNWPPCEWINNKTHLNSSIKKLPAMSGHQYFLELLVLHNIP